MRYRRLHERARLTRWQPLAQVAVRDGELRTAIAAALRDQGWAVVESPSGYHLLQNLAEPLFGNQPWCRPGLLVIDAISPGCSGVTIASGLRELGCPIPAVLICNSAQQRARVQDDPDRHLFVVEAGLAIPAVTQIARHRSRRPLLRPPTVPTSHRSGGRRTAA